MGKALEDSRVGGTCGAGINLCSLHSPPALPPLGLEKGHSLWLRSLQHSRHASWELGTMSGWRLPPPLPAQGPGCVTMHLPLTFSEPFSPHL